MQIQTVSSTVSDAPHVRGISHWLMGVFDSGWLSYFIQIYGTEYAANINQIGM